ncbi:MAG: hypothetical protein KAF40_07810 [Flavihumibacter sp.]|nr:hypothetical protein [Flavihumibacter sp.]
MMLGLPVYVPVLFLLTVIVSIGWFYQATKSRTLLLMLTSWTVLQAILGLLGVYQQTDSLPPRILVFGFFPALLILVLYLFFGKGKGLIAQTNLRTLTGFHSIRILVEIVLLLLFYFQMTSIHMTVEGHNYDILSGVSAVVVALLAGQTVAEKKNLLLWWNIICLLLLFNVIARAILSTPSPLQRWAFDQPNLAVLHFPFNLLPTVIVPLVLVAHLIAIKQLTNKTI